MKLTTVRLLVFLATALVQLPAPSQMSAQGTDSIAVTNLDAFVAAHLAVAALRGRMQAELAELKAKKPEVQAELREKLHVETLRLLREHNITPTEFARLTRLVSTDDAARKIFDETLLRLSRDKSTLSQRHERLTPIAPSFAGVDRIKMQAGQKRHASGPPEHYTLSNAPSRSRT